MREKRNSNNYLYLDFNILGFLKKNMPIGGSWQYGSNYGSDCSLYMYDIE